MARLEIQGRFDRPHVAAGQDAEVRFLLTITPDEALRQLTGGVRAGMHVCMLFDVSQSMEEHDKLDNAIAAGRELVDLVGDNTSVSIVAFDEEAYVLGTDLAVSYKPQVYESLESLRTVGGGMTNIAAGLDKALDTVLAGKTEDRARVIILLSDGEDNCAKPDAVHAAVRGADADVQLFAVGIGDEYEADFLKALVTPSNGSLFGHTEVARVKEAFIDLAATLANVVATRATLSLELAEDVLVGKGYKSSPDQLFLGNTKVGDDRTIMRRVGNIERNKSYAFLYQMRLPPRDLGHHEVLVATLSWDVPELELEGARIDLSCSVECSDDGALIGKRDGMVMETWRRVQITELVERFVEAHKAGRAEDTARYLDLLIRRYDDVGDQKMVNHYEEIQHRLLEGGQITRAMINASVVSSTVVRGGGELPVIIDDSF